MSSGFPTRSDTNLTVQPKNIAGSLQFRIKIVERLYSLCSENKGADQLHGYRTVDLRFLYFGILSKIRFSCDEAHIIIIKQNGNI